MELSSRPFDAHAAVGGYGAHARSARTQSHRQMTAHIALHRYRELDIDMPVYGSGFELRRVAVGDAEMHAAIGGLGIHLAAFPAIARQLNRKPAVGGMAVHSACQAREVSAAVDRVESDMPVHIGNVDAAIVGLDIHVGMPGHEYFIAHAPALMAGAGRPVGAHAAAGGRYVNLAGERLCFGIGIGLRFDFVAHQHVLAAPALHAGSAIHAAIHADLRRCRERLFLNFTVRRALIVAPAPRSVVAVHVAILVVMLLGEGR